MFNKLTRKHHLTGSQSGQRAVPQKLRGRGAIAPGIRRLVMVSLLLGLVIILTAFGERERTYAASDKLPDLGMAEFKDLSIVETTAGSRLLRFGAVIINIGIGAFEVRGSRPDTLTTDMTVVQRIYDTAGGFRDVSTGATMYYSGDGHNHWHIRKLQTYEVIRLDNGSKVEGMKGGFCFWDSSAYNLSLPGAPQQVVYSKDVDPKVCAKGDPDALEAFMGLSVGWADLYGPNLPDQFIDITGLPAGLYRLKGTSDKSNWFLETNENDNCTWTDFQMQSSGTAITIMGTSGDAVSCSGTPPPSPGIRVFLPLLKK